MVACCCLKTECPVCCAVPVSTLPCNPCLINNATSAQKGKDKKKAKYDSLQELRKNKKELEFEQKLYKEKEEMLEKEKQLKIDQYEKATPTSIMVSPNEKVTTPDLLK